MFSTAALVLLDYLATMSATGTTVLEGASRKAVQSAKEAVGDAPNTVKAAVENPRQASADFLHRPAVRAALPFINGGLAGISAFHIPFPRPADVNSYLS